MNAYWTPKDSEEYFDHEADVLCFVVGGQINFQFMGRHDSQFQARVVCRFASAAPAIDLPPIKGMATLEVIATKNIAGSCGTSTVRVLGVLNVFDDYHFYSMDLEAGKIIIQGPTNELILSYEGDVLSNHNGVACVSTKSGNRLLVWSNCAGSGCGDDFSFFVIDPERLVFLAPNDPKKGYCDAKCASQILGSDLPEKIDNR